MINLAFRTNLNLNMALGFETLPKDGYACRSQAVRSMFGVRNTPPPHIIEPTPGQNIYQKMLHGLVCCNARPSLLQAGLGP